MDYNKGFYQNIRPESSEERPCRSSSRKNRSDGGKDNIEGEST